LVYTEIIFIYYNYKAKERLNMSNYLMFDIVDVFLNLLDSLKEYITIILAIALLFSLVQCFFGYRIFKFLIGMHGFILFGVAGIVTGYLYFELEMELCLIMGLILGWLGALLAMELYKINVFLQCFWTGSIIGALLGVIGQLEMEQTAALAIVLGIIIGVVGVILIKPLVILSTAFAGGIISGCIVAFSSNQDIFMGVLLGTIVSICGALYQAYSDERPPKVTPTEHDNPPIQGTN
jgi:hypothetical protein